AQSWLVVSDRQPIPIAYTLRTSFDPRPESEGKAWVAGRFEAWLGREWPVPPVATDAEAVAVRRTALDVHERVWAYEREPAVVVEDMRTGSVRSLKVPDEILNHYRFNRAFESVAIVPDRMGDEIWAGMESPLTIDGPESTSDHGGISRVLIYRADSGELLRTVGYQADLLPEDWQATKASGLEMNTLVELTGFPDSGPDDPKFLLALERAFVSGVGNRGRVYMLDGSTRSVEGFPYPVLEKHLAFDFADLDLSRWGVRNIDNIEGMAIGPQIADRRGGRLVLVVVDDNFGRSGQIQYVYALRVQLPR
ncbi:MAG: esterase-like activity of phytase family protein, partial [Phycisphaerales bacterium]